jgi:transcriptional regulator with XRE-family HTH domain
MADMTDESLPAKLRVLRARQGLTLIEAAERIGIGRDTLSDLERGRRHPVMPTLAKIADGYSVPVEDLLEEPAPIGPKAAAPSRSEQPSEWAREQGARLHGMDPEEWSRFVASLETPEDVTEALRELNDERMMLHALYAAHRWQRPEDQWRRRELFHGVRELRLMLQADLAHVAEKLREGDELVQELGKIVRHEADKASHQEING